VRGDDRSRIRRAPPPGRARRFSKNSTSASTSRPVCVRVRACACPEVARATRNGARASRRAVGQMVGRSDMWSVGHVVIWSVRHVVGRSRGRSFTWSVVHVVGHSVTQSVDSIRHQENAPLARALDGLFCFTLALACVFNLLVRHLVIHSVIHLVRRSRHSVGRSVIHIGRSTTSSSTSTARATRTRRRRRRRSNVLRAFPSTGWKHSRARA